MSRPMYEWKHPITGVTLKWSPLTVGDEMDVESSHTSPAQVPLKQFEVYRRRIVDKGDGKPMEMGEFRAWESSALIAFMRHVNEVEEKRMEQFAKGSDSPLASS